MPFFTNILLPLLILLLAVEPGLANGKLSADDLPIGYISQYSSTISKKTTYYFNHSFGVASRVKNGSNYAFKFNTLQTTADSLAPLSAAGWAIVHNMVLGDFIWEASVKQKSAHSIGLIIAMRDTNNYYQITIQDDGLQIIKKYNQTITTLKRAAFATKTDGENYNFILTRDILARSIKIILNGQEFEISDSDLVMGYIGFKISEGELLLDQMEVWGPTSIEREVNFLDKKL